MAEQSSHDVVEKTLSGGDTSSSDVPASNNAKLSAGGDVGEIKDTAKTTQTQTHANDRPADDKTNASTSFEAKSSDIGKDTGGLMNDTSRHGPGPVESRALELNGMASTSDGGEDTASQGGSESDASRTESKNPRAGSTKKPATFKPVSFAKFTVPKAPGASVSSKPTEKATLSSTTPLGAPHHNPRPRLVAKSTSSIRDSFSKLGTGGVKPGSGPDPNRVWNRNRPTATPPMPQKQLTDEELKQQYGIHMTSRIQEDGGGTEAKWADIEDDEDDWAPETIEWTDGTKITLTHNEPAPPPQPVQEPEPPKISKDIPPPKEQTAFPDVKKVVPRPTTTIGPNPTVLRLGASADRQAKNANALSKGGNGRSSPASTSPAPVPAKSPWAPLPPVEKVSPVVPPVQTQRSPRPSFRGLHSNDNISGPVPPKEIAADDFNRSWREVHTGAPRELYNSRSGRYEPVAETRKGSWRNEQTFRTPSLLQRPVHHEPASPAEPSAAFQTHRSSIQDGAHWNRRRASSNVSGGSGSLGPRGSGGRSDLSQEYVESCRASQVNGTVDQSSISTDLPHEGPSPTQKVPGPAWRMRSPSNANLTKIAPTVGPHAPTETATSEIAAAPQVLEEDPVAMQERIMKEKRLEARQRRLEQEQKEEAERRERIRLKLEALGPPPEKPKSKSKEIQEANKPEGVSATPPTPSQPPKPPVPEPTGEPKQYGMMKVHHPDSVKKLVAANEKERHAEKPAAIINPPKAASPPRDSVPDAVSTHRLRRLSETHAQAHDKLSEPKTEKNGSQWRGNLGVSGYSPWTPNAKLGPVSSPVTNPWKPLSNDKTLGNGLFDQALGGFPPRDLPLRSHLSLDQQPIGPPTTSDRISGPQPFPATSRPPQEQSSMASLPSPEIKHVNPIARPAPIGPPSLQNAQWQQQEARRAQSTAAWSNFQAVATKREAEENEKLLREMNAIRDGPSTLQVNFNETWRQVRTGEQSGQRQVIGITRTTDNNAPPSNLLPGVDPISGLPLPDNHPRPFAGVSVRGSRFFPPAEPPKKPVIDEHEYQRSFSPPPPEESDHPVFTGDSHRPLVHLPAPKPVVKLPPKVVAPPPPPPTFASMAAAPPPPRSVAQHISAASIWQEKINGLFGKKTLTEKKNALAVASASKEPLDVQLPTAAVSVSLPQNVDIETRIGDGETSSRQVEEEEDLFEDREAGSLPVVRVPYMAPPAAWVAALPPSQSRLRSKHLKSTQVHSVEPYFIGAYDKDHSGNIRISIRLPGSSIAKTAILPKKGAGSGPRQRGPNFKPRKNTRSREGPNYYNSKKPSPSQQANASASSPRHQSRNASSLGLRTAGGLN